MDKLWLGQDGYHNQIGISGAVLCHSFGHSGAFFLRNTEPNHFSHPALQQSLLMCAGDFIVILGLN